MGGNLLPAILREENRDLAADYLRDYTERWNGAHFESFGANEPNRITSDDIVAVSMLSVFVPARAAREIVEKDSATIEELLKNIPKKAALTDPDGGALTAKRSAATDLWKLLRAKADVGPTIASKVMAQKRPVLIPIQDSVVRAAVGWSKGSDFWAGLRELILAADDGALPERLRGIREAAEVGDRYTGLRTFDVVVWMAYRDNPATD
jgi:hypothetical protein